MDNIFLDYMYFTDDWYDSLTQEDILNIKALDIYLNKIYSKENGYWYN